MEVTLVFTPLVIQYQFHASCTNSLDVIKDRFLAKYNNTQIIIYFKYPIITSYLCYFNLKSTFPVYAILVCSN